LERIPNIVGNLYLIINRLAFHQTKRLNATINSDAAQVLTNANAPAPTAAKTHHNPMYLTNIGQCCLSVISSPITELHSPFPVLTRPYLSFVRTRLDTLPDSAPSILNGVPEYEVLRSYRNKIFRRHTPQDFGDQLL